MSHYAIGDLQGCYAALQRMLERIDYRPDEDRIFLLGDLVNRGEDSLSVLRWARSNGIGAILGNHDLHLLSVAEGFATSREDDTLHEILTAPDRDELLHWLRHLPLAQHVQGYLLIHAGLLPQWSVAEALALASEVETVLRSAHYHTFLRDMYGNQPAGWHDDLRGADRLRVITNALTRLRFCSTTGEMDFSSKGDPAHPPPGCLPWFQIPNRRSAGHPIVFGHWSALGLQLHTDSIALDTGCLWGGQLTALRLEDRRIYQVDCAELPGTRPLR